MIKRVYIAAQQILLHTFIGCRERERDQEKALNKTFFTPALLYFNVNESVVIFQFMLSTQLNKPVLTVLQKYFTTFYFILLAYLNTVSRCLHHFVSIARRTI